MLQSSSTLYLKYQHCAVSCCLVILLFLTQVQQSAALIIPNELPSLLSLVYSNIPPIKKGTDSRLGFGFRLGEHADFQVLLELGPQKETRPIGDQENSDGSSFNKRQVNKIQQLRIQPETISSEHPAASWLEKWSNDANSSKKNTKTMKKQFADKPAVLPAMPQLPDQTLRQLQMLYKMATSSTPSSTLSSTESTLATEEINAAIHEGLKKEKTKTEITKQLKDVSLDK